MIESPNSYTGYYVRTLNLPHTEKWYEHTPQPVTESTEATILWDFTINTDRKIVANRPDITIKNVKVNTCIMVDVKVRVDKIIFLKVSRSFLNVKIFKLRFQKCRNSRPKQFKILSIKSEVNHRYRKCREQYSQVLLTYYKKCFQCK